MHTGVSITKGMNNQQYKRKDHLHQRGSVHPNDFKGTVYPSQGCTKDYFYNNSPADYFHDLSFSLKNAQHNVKPREAQTER